MAEASLSLKREHRSEAVRTALIEKAEAMFGQGGIDGVSLRQIGAAIGSANTNVVGYYFGNKAALIEAIFHYRLPSLDARRAELLGLADQAGRGGDLSTLMNALWRPLFEQTGPDGTHSYARFLGAVSRSDWGLASSKTFASFPVTIALTDRIAAAMAPETASFFRHRIRIAATIAVAILYDIDQLAASDPEKSGQDLFADALRMASAAMIAPAA